MQCTLQLQVTVIMKEEKEKANRSSPPCTFTCISLTSSASQISDSFTCKVQKFPIWPFFTARVKSASIASVSWVEIEEEVHFPCLADTR